MRTINDEGLALIKEFEGCRLESYLCPAGVPTIGYGHTRSAEMGQAISEAESEALLREDLKQAEEAVDHLVIVPIDENQFSALVSFVFNVGVEAFTNSTLLKKINAEEYDAADQLLRWNKVGDEAFSGLTRRRHAERALFLSEDWKTYLF